METLVNAMINKQNAILTSLGGVECSRFLLKAELAALSKTDRQESFKRIFHVVRSVNLIKVYQMAQMLNKDPKITIAKTWLDHEDDEAFPVAQIVVCVHPDVLSPRGFGKKLDLSSCASLIVLDGIPLFDIEENLYGYDDRGVWRLDDDITRGLANDPWSIVSACDGPIDGIEFDFNCSFPIKIEQDLPEWRLKRSYRVFSSILSAGPNNVPMTFPGRKDIYAIHDKVGQHDEVGRVVEECAKRIDSGAILVFFRSLVKLCEYHKHWENSGLFRRIGLPYVREDWHFVQLKQMMANAMRKGKKSIVLVVRQSNQENYIKDYIYSSRARVVISVGLSQLISLFEFDRDSSRARPEFLASRLGSGDWLKYRGLEFLNGLFVKCLNVYRTEDCAFFILDDSLGTINTSLPENWARLKWSHLRNVCKDLTPSVNKIRFDR